MLRSTRVLYSKLSWLSFDPKAINGKNPAKLQNLVNGTWKNSSKTTDIIDPLNGEAFIKMPDTQESELAEFVSSMNAVPKSGLHNPFKNVDKYVKWGAISAKAAELLGRQDVEDAFTASIQRTCPKSTAQAVGEVRIVRQFLYNFSGDSVRFLSRGFMVSGDHDGQQSNGYRWPYGPVAIIAPFNFPLEIPALQLMGALYMGNKPVIKGASYTSLVVEQFVRLLIEAGMSPNDVDVIHCGGRVMNKLITSSNIRLTQFTGSQGVAEKLARDTAGKVRLEDAGFNWKILGPQVEGVDYVAWQCDQDAYANTGQKCSAQSMLFVHKNWAKTDFFDKLAKIAAQRKLTDLTIAPVLSHSTDEIIKHATTLAKIPGAKILFGGKELSKHTIPKNFGAVEPTAVFVPLKEILKKENIEACTTEIFGPFQVVTEYDCDTLDQVLELCERIPQHLTASVVSNCPKFLQKVLANTVNGTTYVGLRARTTGAPQNHWFGPAGDPRGAGIGSPEAIRMVWSCHREVVTDQLIPEKWTAPKPT